MASDPLTSFIQARTKPDPLTKHLDDVMEKALHRAGGGLGRKLRRHGREQQQWETVLTMLKTAGSISKIRGTPAGVEAQVRLENRHAAQTILSSRETLAGVFRVARIDAVPDPDDASCATLILFKHDLLKEKAGTPWPGVENTTGMSLWDPIEFGWDEHGESVSLSVMGRHMGIFGETGSGKSVAQSMIVATAALSNARIFLMDANEIQLGRWRPIAERFVVDDIDAAVSTLEFLVSEIGRRNNLIAGTGLDKLDRDLDKRLGEPPMLLMVDEGADFLRVKNFTDTLTRLCARGRAAGLCVVYASQSANATIIPTPLRNNLGLRAVFRVADRSASTVALGTSLVDASAIEPADRGVCYLHQDGVLPLRMRTFYPTPEQVREMCTRAVHRRP